MKWNTENPPGVVRNRDSERRDAPDVRSNRSNPDSPCLPMNQSFRFRHQRFGPDVSCPCPRHEKSRWCTGALLPDDGVSAPGCCAICWHCARVMIADETGAWQLRSEAEVREHLRDMDHQTRLQFEAWLESAKKHIGIGPNEEAPV